MSGLASPAAFAGFVALLLATGVMRVVELTVSARRLRRQAQAPLAEPTFPLMVLVHVGLVFGPVAEVLWLDRPFVPLLALAAGLVLAGATALRVWTLRAIGRAWNVRVVLPERVATTGPYAWIRHPNYLAVILEVASLPLIHGAWVSCLTLSALDAFVLWRRIRVEEAALAELPAWRAAMAPRARFVPGLF